MSEPSAEINKFFTIRTPLFSQVKEAIMNKVRSGEWPCESMLPNEIELAKLFNVSQGTIRRAVRELCEENVLIRKQGRGTFVCSYNSELNIFRKKFIYVRNDDQTKKWITYTKCVLFEIIEPSLRVMKLLDLNANDKVIHIRRHHFTQYSDRVEAFDELYLPQKFFSSLTKEIFEKIPNSVSTSSIKIYVK